jgi:phosphatidylinositol alpha-1,6-mannosyltransferase
MTILLLFSGLDPKQGGVQVSGINVVPAFEGTVLRGIVYGADPEATLENADSALIETRKPRLVARLLQRRWTADVALVWHIGVLKLLPFLRGFRGRTILFLHGIELWRSHGWLTRRLLRHVDLFLSNSDYTWKRFQEHAPFLVGRPHITTPLGVGEPLQGPSPLPGSRPSAVILGRIDKGEDYKGHRELITAWPDVLATLPDATLEIVGDGDLRPDLEVLAQKAGLAGSVRFHGRVSEEVKAKLIAGARCLAMPSRGEGFGLVYLEAMRIGRPCLVSNCDAGREVVNPPEAGLAVDPGSTAELVAAILRLLTSGDEWNRWSVAARRRYEDFFTAEQYRRRLKAAVSGPVDSN